MSASMAIDVIADTHQFAPPAKKFQGWLQDGRIDRTRSLLLKPGTFMNRKRPQRARRDGFLQARAAERPRPPFMTNSTLRR